MKNMLMRPTAALFPAVLLLGAFFGAPGAAANLFVCWLMLQLCSLCSVDAFRNAAAREPGVRRVDRRFSGAWIMILLGLALVTAILKFFLGVNPLDPAVIAMPAAVGCIYIEQLFEERMFALSRVADGVVLGVISNVILLAGMMLDGSGGVTAPVEIRNFYTLCGAGLGMLISVMANYAMEPMRAFSLIPRNIGFFPKAAAQALLYPAAMIGIMQGVDLLFEEAVPLQDMDFPAVFAGMMLWRISRTVCRRAADESRPLNLLLMVVCAALAAGSLWAPALVSYANAAAIAMICALMVFCAPGWRVYLGAALLIAANAMLLHPVLQGDLHLAAVCAGCAIAVVLNLHKAFLRKV